MNRRAAWSAAVAMALMFCQFAVIRTSPSGMAVRIVVPLTMLAVPVALSPFRHRIGVWIMYVGMAANLVVIVANGGLMPIERHTLVSAVGDAGAAHYATSAWVSGSKDVLVASGSGRLVALGDSIIIRFGGAGLVASPGDLVVWAGLLVLAAEASIALQRSRRALPGSAGHVESAPRAGAEGGAATRT